MALTNQNHPLMRLSGEDLAMITSFVLVSGSIKDLAAQYGISYPTMRQRLDQLIERVRAAVEDRPADALSNYLADLIASGHLSSTAARQIRNLHRNALNEHSD